jgi:hypothetical protein
MPELSGGDKLISALNNIASGLKGRGTLRVGFLAGSTYPDGTSVPVVAMIQEFGAPRAGIPPRPYFRTMIARESPGWPAMIAGQLKKTNYDVNLTLGRVGEAIKGRLQQSIRDLTDPPLSPVTLMVRQIVGPNGRATLADVLEARRRVAAGQSAQGVSSKPLVWTGTLLNSVGVEVET